jgi:hypothetical protein
MHMSNLLDLDEVLNKTQSIRYQIVDDIMKNGVPTSKEDLDVLAKTLDSLDRAVIAKKRISVEENVINHEKEASRLLGEMLSQFVNPRVEKVIDRTVFVNAELRDKDIVPYENYVGIQDIELDKIMDSE